MRRILALAAVLLISAAALYLSQRRTHKDVVSPDAVLDVAADLQRDVTRAPMRFTRLSDAEESRIGDTLAKEYLSGLPEPTPGTQATEHYVGEVGVRIASHARRRFNYRFHLIPDANFINAFAIPGGHVFIGQGLINQMTTEDELASVLGHEIEHIDHYHAVERVQIEARLHSLNLDAIAALTQIPMSLWQAGYSKDEESEADREGLRLAVSAGYSPQGAIEMFNRLLELDHEYVTRSSTPTGELTQVAVESLEGYFRSHPEPSERLAQAQKVIADDRLDSTRPQTILRTAETAATRESTHP